MVKFGKGFPGRWHGTCKGPGACGGEPRELGELQGALGATEVTGAGSQSLPLDFPRAAAG